MSVSSRLDEPTAAPETPASAWLRGTRVAEQYRALRAVIEAAGSRVPLGAATHQGSLVILVAGIEHGAADIGIRLAAAFADGGHETLLLDADLHSPACHRLLKEGGATLPGLAEWLRGPEDVAYPTYSTGFSNFALLPAGTGAVGPDPLKGERLDALFADIRRDRQRTVIVAPPIAASADALFLAPFSDGAVLAVVPGKTGGPAAQRARDSLIATGARIYGVILADQESR